MEEAEEDNHLVVEEMAVEAQVEEDTTTTITGTEVAMGTVDPKLTRRK